MSELALLWIGLPLFAIFYGVTLWYQLTRWPGLRDAHHIVAHIDPGGPMHEHIHDLMLQRRDYMLVGWCATWIVDFFICSRSHILWVRLLSVGIWAALVIVTATFYAWRLIRDSHCPPRAPVLRSGNETPTPGDGFD